MMNVHKKLRRYSDQCYCAECGKQWDINDPEPPACVIKKTPAERIEELRDILKRIKCPVCGTENSYNREKSHCKNIRCTYHDDEHIV